MTKNKNNIETISEPFSSHEIDKRINRLKKFINWLIDGQFQHGISPMSMRNLTPEKVEELYNVDFGN